MADIYFRKTKIFGGSYWRLIGVRNMSPDERSGLNLELNEYLIVSGDIGGSKEQVESALALLRDDLKKDGHRLHFVKSD